MYIYVSLEMETDKYYESGPPALAKAHLEQACGERCLIVPYEEMSMKVVTELSPRAIAMSGFGGHFQDKKIEWFYGVDEVLHEARLPIICFCGSHQLLAFCYHHRIRRLKELRDQPMRKLKPNEHWPRSPSGYFAADGFFPIRQVKEDPLFAGLPETMIMRCWHYCEVKRLPPGFVRIASSRHCRIEAMRHKHKLLYGTQFHPEFYAEPFLHGKRLLANFAGIVEAFWREQRSDLARPS